MSRRVAHAFRAMYLTNQLQPQTNRAITTSSLVTPCCVNGFTWQLSFLLCIPSLVRVESQ
jgi:hypothetical protein